MIIIFARNARMLFQRNCLRRVEQDHLPMEESIIVIAMTKVIREINNTSSIPTVPSLHAGLKYVSAEFAEVSSGFYGLTISIKFD